MNYYYPPANSLHPAINQAHYPVTDNLSGFEESRKQQMQDYMVNDLSVPNQYYAVPHPVPLP